jgi:NAD(P)-dependent dehydrogenase (short-subunit alcohol dehydrogenase family)
VERGAAPVALSKFQGVLAAVRAGPGEARFTEAQSVGDEEIEMTATVAGRLEGKVAVVTGASTGIGRATFELFARAGAQVVGASRTQARLDETLAAVESAGGTGVVVAADLSQDAGAERVVQTAVESFGGIDILVSNAGVGYSYKAVRPLSMEPLVDTPLEEWDHVMGINLNSVVYMARRVIPEMRRRGGGSIINVASIWGLTGAQDAHAYTTAKGAIVNLSRSLAVAHGRESIRANALCPGFIDTPMIAPVHDALNDKDYALTWNPMGRTGTPQEIAYAALFLASDESSYCNGSVMVVDGGTTAVW